MTTRIFLVDDHEIVRRGLFDLLGGGVEDFVVVGEAASVGGKRWLRYRRATPTSLFWTYACLTATASNCAENSARCFPTSAA